MKTLKMSLANIQGKMSRNEMRKIIAGGSNMGSAACAASKTMFGNAICCASASIAQNIGANGWWCCNCSEAFRVCM